MSALSFRLLVRSSILATIAMALVLASAKYNTSAQTTENDLIEVPREELECVVKNASIYLDYAIKRGEAALIIVTSRCPEPDPMVAFSELTENKGDTNPDTSGGMFGTSGNVKTNKNENNTGTAQARVLYVAPSDLQCLSQKLASQKDVALVKLHSGNVCSN